MKAEAVEQGLKAIDLLHALKTVRGPVIDELNILKGNLLKERNMLNQRKQRMIANNMKNYQQYLKGQTA